jgi:hypothetical protein
VTLTTDLSLATWQAWYAGVSKRQIRLIESFQDVLLPDGRRLRGVQLAIDLYMDRQKQLFLRVSADRVESISQAEVLQRYEAQQVVEGWQRSLSISRQRRGSEPRLP